MALRDPVAVYNAATNMEAGFVRDALLAAGIEAFFIEDVSQVGTWMGGLVPEIHKPQVWVERADMARAKPVLDEFERRARERREGSSGPEGSEEIEVVCEECGKAGWFPATQLGSVQECPHCRAYIDIVDDDKPEDWPDAPSAEEASEDCQ